MLYSFPINDENNLQLVSRQFIALIKWFNNTAYWFYFYLIVIMVLDNIELLLILLGFGHVVVATNKALAMDYIMQYPLTIY